jgi:beta-xylosidase
MKTAFIGLFAIIFLEKTSIAQWSNYSQISSQESIDAMSVIDDNGNKYIAGSFYS